MAITTLDGVIAGAQQPNSFHKLTGTLEGAGILRNFIYDSGSPGAAVAPTPGLAGAALTSYAGQIPFVNPGSGNTYLLKLAIASTMQGSAILIDRLWHNSGFTITTTTAQTVNSAAFPARDEDGSTNGNKVLVGIEVSTVTGNGSPVTNTTMSYTNQSGTSGRTATIASFPATAVAGTFIPFTLQAGDKGVRSIQSLTLGTSYVSGTIHLVAYRILSRVDITVPQVLASVDALSAGFTRMYDNTVPNLLWLPIATTGFTMWGDLHVTQG